MKRVIFLFLDGVGLGANDPTANPLAAADLPVLSALVEGAPLVAETGRLSTTQAELVPTDAHLGVEGRPQSATGQTAILTGVNAPARLGEHYGPRPDARVRAILDESSLFLRLRNAGFSPYFCNAYPHGFFAAVERGKRLLSAVPYAAQVGGQTLLNYEDLRDGRALAADFTNRGWREQLGYADVPVFTPAAGGRELWRIAQPYDFVFFEHWLTDMLGHRGQLAEAVAIFERFDAFLGGLLAAADLEETLIIVSSDHGNVEDCSHRKHTHNHALTLILGAHRRETADRADTLTGFADAVATYLGASEPASAS